MDISLQFHSPVLSTDPAEAASYMAALLSDLSEQGWRVEAQIVTNDGTVADGKSDAAKEFTVQEQLDRLGSYWKTRRPFLTAIHNGLIELGYDPRVPVVRGDADKKPASYIRYVDPANDEAPLGTTNSGAFLFVGQEMKDRLAERGFTSPGRDGVRIQFDSAEAVELILDVAAQAKVQSSE